MALVVESGLVHGRKDAALLPLRAALGSTMIYHGISKLKQERREQTGQMFEQIGLRPGKPLAVATGAAEVFAGIASVLGLLTPPAAPADGATPPRRSRRRWTSIALGGMAPRRSGRRARAWRGRVRSIPAAERRTRAAPARLWRRSRASREPRRPCRRSPGRPHAQPAHA